MKRPVLVSVSGMVGSGKTTVARQVLAVMQRAGIDVEYWRFQRLSCITLRPWIAASVARDVGERRPAAPRGHADHLRQLTASRALGYLVRIVAFRIYCRWPPGPGSVVLNRYFYDSFAHYDLSKGAGRFYTAILRRLLPKPDIAFLMVASPQTLAARRPQYSAEYLTRGESAYRRLPTMFSELIEIDSEGDAEMLERVAGVVRERLALDAASRLGTHRTTRPNALVSNVVSEDAALGSRPNGNKR